MRKCVPVRTYVLVSVYVCVCVCVCVKDRSWLTFERADRTKQRKRREKLMNFNGRLAVCCRNDVCIVCAVNGRTDGRTDGRMDGRTDGYIHTHTHTHTHIHLPTHTTPDLNKQINISQVSILRQKAISKITNVYSLRRFF